VQPGPTARKGRWRRLVPWLGLWPLLAWSAAASAQTALPSDTRIVVSGCSMRINERALQDQVRIELLAAGVQRVRTVELYADELPLEDEPAEVATLRITFADCDEISAEIKLGVAARKTGEHLERLLNVSDVPATMYARAIALALTELLRASWHELSTGPSSEPPRPSPHPQLVPRLHADVLVQNAAESAATLAIRQRLRLEWHGGARMYPQTDTGEANSALGLSKLFGERTRLLVLASVAGGGGQGSDARLFQSTARTTLSLCGRSADPALEVGASIELGYAHLAGTQAGRTHGFISTALVHGTLRVQAAQEIEALVTLQAGYVLAPVTLRSPSDANGFPGPEVGFRGAVIGIEIGLAGLL
jgi:hypothetical protein